MGLIAALKRFFGPSGGASINEPGPRIAELLRQDQALLEQALGDVSYELHDEDVGLCRVVTDRCTISFGWDWRERWITAAVRLLHPPDLPFAPHLEYDSRSWLEACGEVPPSPRAGPRSSALVRDEFPLVQRVVMEILSDESKVRQALHYLDGRSQGYTDAVVIPEDLPPEPIILWTEKRLRQSGLAPKFSRAGERR